MKAKTKMKKFLAAVCAAALIMTVPGMSIAAAEIPGNEAVDVSEENDIAAVVNEDTLEEDLAAIPENEQGDISSADEDMETEDDSSTESEEQEDVVTEESSAGQEAAGNMDELQEPDDGNADADDAAESIPVSEKADISEEEYSVSAVEELTEENPSMDEENELVGNVTPILKDYPVGTRVTATVYLQAVPSMEDPTYLESTYDIQFTAKNNGTLAEDWKERINEGLHANGVQTWLPRVAAVSFYTSGGKFYLPADSSELFADMERLFSIDLSMVDTSKVHTMSYMFRDCARLTRANVTGLDTSSFWGLAVMGMFKHCKKLTILDLSSWDTSMITSTYEMFKGCRSLEKINLTGFKTNLVWNMGGMFKNCQALKELNLSSFVTGSVSDMTSMFENCKSLKKLDLSMFRTPQLTDMDYMFSGCESLAEINLKGIDTSKVITMSHMFCRCYALHDLDVSKFNTSNVTDMTSMFQESGLQSLNLKNFNTSKVTEMSFMFNSCMGLTELDLSSFDTANVRQMDDLFANDYNLKYLDLSSFDMSKVEQPQGTYEVAHMFYDCTNFECLKTPKKTVQVIYLYLEMYDETGNVYKNLPKLTKSITLWNTPPDDISSASISGISLSYGYSGKPYTPAFSVILHDVELEAGVDYTYKFTNNINPGTAKLTVTGKGHYTGTKIRTFAIVNCVSEVLPGRTYMLVPKNNSKTAVCSFSGGVVNNTRIYITDQSASEAMRWRTFKNSDGSWTFINVKCELVMAVQQNSTVCGKGLVLYERTGKKAQSWRLEKKSDNSFAIRNAVTGYSVSMSKQSAVKGTTLSVQKTQPSGLQRFYIVEADPVDHSYDGQYTIHASANQKYVVNVSGASKADGANVNLNLYSNISSKKFKFKYSGSGYYRIENLNSGMVLTVKGNSPMNGANVIQSVWRGQAGQRWKVIKNSNGTVSLRNPNGTVLHLVSNKRVSGNNIVAGRPSPSAAQKWYLKTA